MYIRITSPDGVASIVDLHGQIHLADGWTQTPVDIYKLAPGETLDDEQGRADLAMRQVYAAQVNSFVAAIKKQMTGNADTYTVTGWIKKYSRAGRILADNPSPLDTKLMEIEIQERGRGETLTELATKIIAKGDRYEEMIIRIDASTKQTLDTIAISPANEVPTVVNAIKTKAMEQLAAF